MRSVAEYLPEVTRDFVLSEWYYSDWDKCPHDAWVEAVEVFEKYSGERMEIREVGVRTRLLSASHRGHIHFEYLRVSSYELDGALASRGAKAPMHEDWLSDEVTLAGRGELEHEILFSSGTVWRIRCATISYRYSPTPIPSA
jgi:hypothetical protein